MPAPRINLYSDTQTQPSPGMRQAMANAQVGDEQKGEDPTVNLLCEQAADLLGKEAAMFLPSGTMCNEIALVVHCRAGDEIIADKTSHIIKSESGGPAVFAGAMVKPLDGEFGIYSEAQLHDAINAPSRHAPRSRLVEIEQTANFGGGNIWPKDHIAAIAAIARSHGLATHMDGARLMNAVVAAGVCASEFAAQMDSVWLDLSKGLGCPVGGVLAGSAGFIEDAWRWKHRMGGAMRQAGIVAAAGVYAFAHNIDRLAEDHDNARIFADRVRGCDLIQVVPADIKTNIVFLDVSAAAATAAEVCAQLEQEGIRLGAMGKYVLRAVTHMDVNRDQVIEAADRLLNIVGAK